MTDGRRLLLAVLQIIPAREVALRVHVSQMAVSYWRAGLRNPSPASRRMLEQHLNIPADLWEPSSNAQRNYRRRY